MPVLLVLSLLASTAALAADVPEVIQHQGRLFDGVGVPLDGSNDLDFKLFDAPAGGVEVWAEAHSLDFTDGYFSVDLGQTDPIDDATVNHDELWLEISVNSGPPLTRMPVNSVPYAVRANGAVHAESADTAALATTAQSVSGGVVDASELQINGTTVIDGSGTIIAPSTAPGSLGSLTCSTDEVALWNGTDWVCGPNNPSHDHDASQIATGTLDVQRLPIGTGANEVAAGDHLHALSTLTGQLTESQLPGTFDSLAVAAMGGAGNGNPLNHDRYSDAEAVTAMGAAGSGNPLNHSRFSAGEAVSAMGGVGNGNPLNHARYADAEAVSAMGGVADGNPLNHDRYDDAEAVSATASSYVDVSGDTMSGALTVNNTVNGLRYYMRDTRAVDDPPTAFNHEVRFEFKARGTVGAPGSGTYSGHITFAPWADNSGDAHHQLNLNEGGIFWRQGQPQSGSWGAWTRVWTGDDEAGNSTQDILAYVQKTACENRRGAWVEGSGCQEYAYYTGQCQYNSCSCASGYHKCTFGDMFSGGFESLRRPGYNISGASYAWIAGNYISGSQDRMFYPWGYQNDYITCSGGAHFMWDARRNASGNNAWGCYYDTYTGAAAACCRDNQ